MRVKIKVNSKNVNKNINKNNNHYDKYMSKYWDQIYSLPDVEINGDKIKNRRIFIKE